MFAYFRKSILVYAKSSNVNVCTVDGKYSYKDASEYTLVLCSALIILLVCFLVDVKIFEIFITELPCSVCRLFVWVFICLGFFTLCCKFSSELPVSVN